MAAIAVGGAIAQGVGQQKQASAQAKFQNTRYKSIASESIRSYQSSLNDMNVRNAQEDTAATQAADANAKQAQATRSRASVLAAAAGTSGNSVNRALADFSRMEYSNELNIWRNRAWQRDAFNRQADALQAQAQGRISSGTPGPVTGPNWAALGIQAAGGVTGAAAYHQQRMDAKGLDFWGRE
jgi:hypothetical protein